jgi:hypothetical protein
MIAKIENEIVAKPQVIDLYTLYTWYKNGKIITAPEFLQRELERDKWKSNNNQNAREYTASCYKSTNVFDTFSVVLLSKLIQIVEEKTKSEKEPKKVKEFNKLLKFLKGFEDKGAEYVSMDGQSRLILGIVEYMSDSFHLDKAGRSIKLTLDGKPSNCLQDTVFSKLSDEVKTLFHDKKVLLNVVIDFSELEDVVEALVNKQKGFDWTWFQIVKQSNRFNLSTIQLIESVDEKFKVKYKEKLYSLSNDLKYYSDGYQLFLTQMSYFLQYGEFPTKLQIQKELFGDNIKINKSSYEKIQEYCLEYFKAFGDTKSTITPLINYICIRQLLDNKKSQSNFMKQIGLSDSYIVKNTIELVNYFYKLHQKLANKKSKHKASFIQDANGNWVLNKAGYSASCGKQDNENIFRRIEIYLQYMDIEHLISNDIIFKVKNTTMPSKIDVAVYRDFKDVAGNDIMISDLSEMDRSHFDSKKNKGSNELNNLGLEDLSENRSRQEENLQI